MPTNIQLKQSIDTDVTNKTSPASISPVNVGTSIKSTIDYVDQEKRPYKVYTAFLNQTGTNIPVATVFENTIGTITWSRNFAGDYMATLTGPNIFTINKTLCLPDRTMIGHGQPSSQFWTTHTDRFSDTQIRLFTLKDYVSTDGLISNLFVEFRVYN